ncbi:matrix extracellular phosphoglycoprotein [Haemorhous mexicanus]|uniref:matrix extracellular phosphoglycoprotein n=1 Tax=Haemorhous mexicanus TaxID=30427 RepID=UPI0028BD787C|nr:matrix extracellular phosphoglycoprotein [Haemorhous mexicanus]
MQTSLVCLCLCLLSTALATPVPPQLPERAAGNCVGQHRILLKRCNAKHGFYIFKYVYSFSTRRNQTQIKKEEADHQSIIPSHWLDEGNARREPPAGSAGTAPEHSDNSSTEVIEYGIIFNPENLSTPGISRDDPSTHPGTGMRARGSGGGMGPTPSSSEGSGDLDLVVEADGSVPILPQGERPSEVVMGNRSMVRSENKDDGAPRVVPVGGAMTAGRGRAPTTRGAGDEGSGEATVSGQGQESVKQSIGTGGIALSSVTEKMEDVQVDAAGVDEYTYVPDSGSVTITHGSMGSTDRAHSFTQVSPGKDDEVNIFIGRANIHVGEQVTTQAGVTVSRENDDIPSVGSSRPLHKLDITVPPSGDEDDSKPARRQPERLATTATPNHGNSITNSLRNGRLTGEDEEGATTIGVDRGLVTPVPWRVTSGDITNPTVASIHGKDDDELRGEGQKSKGKPNHVATTIPHHRGDMEATITVPAKRASIHPAATEGDLTTPPVTASNHKAGMGTVLGRGGSGEVGTATSTPFRVEARPGAGMRVRPGGPGLDKTPRMDKAPFQSGKPSGGVLSGAQRSVGSYDGDTGGRSLATKGGASPAPQAGQDKGSIAAGRGWEWGRGAESGTGMLGAGSGRLPGHHSRRLGAGVSGTIATLGRSRQLDQVKRADELHVRERAFYSLGGEGGSPHGPYPGLGSADSSQSSEGDWGSHSESGQTGLQPSGWGSPGYSQGHWIQGPL